MAISSLAQDQTQDQTKPVPKAIAPASPIAPPVPGVTPPVAKGAPPTPQSADQILSSNPVQYGVKDIGQLQQQELTLGNEAAKLKEKALNDQQANLVRSEQERTKLYEDINNREKTLTEQHQNDLREADPFAPSKQTAGELAQMFGLMSIATFGSGGMGKYHGLATLSAMSGLSQGFKEGNKERYNQEKANYEENLKQLESHNQKVEKTFNDAMNLLSKNKELGEQKIKQLIALDNTGPVASLARAGRLDDAGKMIESVKASLEKIRERQQNLADAKTKIDYEFKKRREEKKAELELKFGPNVGGAMANIYHATGLQLPKEDAFKVMQAGQALRAVDSLQQKLADPEVQTGLRAIPSTFFEKVKSLTDPADINQAIDDLDANQKTVLALKDSLLISLTIEQARSGARVPVFTQKTVGPILALTNYQPQTYNALLQERKDELYGIGQDNGIPRDGMSAVARIAPEGSATPTPANQGKPTPTADDIAYAKAHPEVKDKFVAKFGREP